MCWCCESRKKATEKQKQRAKRRKEASEPPNTPANKNLNPDEWEDSEMEFVTSLWNNSSNFAQAFFAMQDQTQGFSLLPVKDEEATLGFHSNPHSHFQNHGAQPFSGLHPEPFGMMPGLHDARSAANAETSTPPFGTSPSTSQTSLSMMHAATSGSAPSPFSFGTAPTPSASSHDEKRPFFQAGQTSAARSW